MEGSADSKKAIDILNPLATVKWERRGSLPAALPKSIQVVLVNDRLCVGTEYTVYLASPDLKSWKTMVTRAHDFALVCYNSKILTIGGLDSACAREITGKSWVLDVAGQTYEPSSLPPLLQKRHSASAITVESAECLVVAGGADNKNVLDSVEVLLNGKWTFIQRLPTPEFGLRAAVHDGNLYFTGSTLSIYSCKVADILQACANSDSEDQASPSFWRIVHSTLSHKSPVSFGKHFCVVGVDDCSSVTRIEMLSPNNPDKQWVNLAEGPSALKNRASVVLLSGNILVVGNDTSDIYLGVLNMPSFSSNTKFSELALSKLEEHGMPVLKAMEILVNDVKKAIKLHLNAEEENKLSEITGEEYVSAVLRLWLAGKGLRSPTWRSLLDLLRDINEEKLSQQIESYLNATSISSISRSHKRPRSLAASSVTPAAHPRITRVKEQPDASPFSTPRRSARVRSRPSRYGTPHS